MKQWKEYLPHDPILPLLDSGNKAIHYFTRRDLQDESVEPIKEIWDIPEVKKIIKKQQADGSWKSTSNNLEKTPAVNYSLIETWKQFRFVVEQYEITREHPVVEKGAEYLFSCQTEEGDIRGILGNQYAAYYTGAILSLLIKAGYEDDSRIKLGLQWLLSVRQEDGGWLANALMSLDLPWKEVTRLTSQKVDTIPYKELSKPSSHNWTGMIIRAFANHSTYKNIPEVLKAAELLKSRFFQRDPHYTSYQSADYWIKFQFPFWWNNLVAAMDSLSRIGFTSTDPDIALGLNWLIDNQQKNGLWKLNYADEKPKKHSKKSTDMQLWITLSICRILKRFYPL
ncbi:MAG: hypothetical protein INQ03_01015 [Candidatus Heimdallarchaeota archaeon]|nr:hypothetical protein [Candidatus Heimdallarchaeota archaeon]